jgi:hypothetical protein
VTSLQGDLTPDLSRSVGSVASIIVLVVFNSLDKQEYASKQSSDQKEVYCDELINRACVLYRRRKLEVGSHLVCAGDDLYTGFLFRRGVDDFLNRR